MIERRAHGKSQHLGFEPHISNHIVVLDHDEY